MFLSNLILESKQVRHFSQWDVQSLCWTLTKPSVFVFISAFSTIPYKWKFSPGENFHQFHHLLPLREFYPRICFLLVFTALAKIVSLENYYDTKIAGLGKISSHENFWLYSILNPTDPLALVSNLHLV